MAKNILLKDQEPAAKGKTTKGKRKKAAPKAETSSAFSFALLGQMKDTWADERTRSVSGLVALGLALIFTLSVFSSLFTGALDIRILQNAGATDELEAYHNILGSLGAHVGYFLARQGLGIGALALPFLLGLLGLRWLTDRAFLPLAKTFRISAFLAMFLPLGLGVLDPHHGGPHPARHECLERPHHRCGWFVVAGAIASAARGHRLRIDPDDRGECHAGVQHPGPVEAPWATRRSVVQIV